MTKFQKRYRSYLTQILYIFIVIVGMGESFGETKSDWISESELLLSVWQKEMAKWHLAPPSVDIIEKRKIKSISLRKEAETCIEKRTGELSSLKEKIEALGIEDTESTVEIKTVRSGLKKTKTSIESILAKCRLLSLATREVLDNLKLIQYETRSAALSRKGKPVWGNLFGLLKQPPSQWMNTIPSIDYWSSIAVGLVVLLFTFPLARYLSNIILEQSSKRIVEDKISGSGLLLVLFAKRLPWMSVIVSLATMAYLIGLTFFGSILVALLISLALAPLVELLICQGVPKCSQGIPSRLLLDVVLIGLVAKISGFKEFTHSDIYQLSFSVYLLILVLTSLWLLRSFSKRENIAHIGALQIPIAVALVAGPIANWFGYYALSVFLVSGVYGTLAGVLVVWGISYTGGQFFAMFEPTDEGASTGLRKFLGYKADELVPGLWLGRLVLFVSIAILLLYWLLISWDMSPTDISAISLRITEGFKVGAITIVPSKLVTGIVAFFLLLTFARWLRNRLSGQWLEKTRLDTGAKQSIVSLTTYMIVGVGFVLALSMAGVEFQNIAIVAGALSVGIGFGLQNIVNNFISGLILLFERPVKPGDWVVVGNTEGYIRKISIRYTQIQTFDRADVLVPNSELISSQVTNWMLDDSWGRAVIPISVAYGSDTQLVKKTLLKLAIEHPSVITNSYRVPEPSVIFRNFGDSSLDFELRCFVREIDTRLTVRSDLLFAIDDAFKKLDIEIPFPQRVVHLKEPEKEVFDREVNGSDRE